MQAIKKHETAHSKYAKRLVTEGVASQEQVDEIHTNITRLLNEAFEARLLQSQNKLNGKMLSVFYRCSSGLACTTTTLDPPH